METPEADLIAAARHGDHAAYGTLVERYQSAIYRLAYRILQRHEDAEDAAQEAFVRAYVNLGSYNPRFRFYTWLAAITSHYCYRQLRKRYMLRLPSESYELRNAAFIEDGPELALLLHERDAEVHTLLSELPERSRDLLILRHWHALSYEEIASASNQSLSAVKSQLYRARRQLARCMLERGLGYASV